MAALDKPKAQANKFAILKATVLIIGGIASLILIFNPTSFEYPPGLGRAAFVSLGILILAIVLWITEYMHSAFVGFICCVAIYTLGNFMGESKLVSGAFAGFMSASVWHVFGGLLLGCGIMRSGISRRLFIKLLSIGKGSYSGLVALVMLAGVILLFLLPSTDGRTILLISVLLGMKGIDVRSSAAEVFSKPKKSFFGRKTNDKPPDEAHLAKQAESDSRPLKGIFIMIPVSTSVLGIGVLSSASAILCQGMIQTHMGITVSYLDWIIYYLPASIAIIFFCYWMAAKFYKCPIDMKNLSDSAREENKKLPPMSPNEIRVLIIFSLAISLWIGGSFFNLRPDIVAMGCSSLLLIPKIGFLKKKDLMEDLNWLIAPLFLGSALSIVETMNSTGMLPYIGNIVFGGMLSSDGSTPILVTMIMICLIATFLHVFSARSTVLVASFLPLLLAWSVPQGLGLFVPLTFLWGAQVQFMAYQSGAITAAYGYGEFNTPELLKSTVPLGIFMVFVGPVILYFWWLLIGLV